MGARSAQTIKLMGEIKGRTIHMLVDSGSTHSFMNTKTLQKVYSHHQSQSQKPFEGAQTYLTLHDIQKV